MVVKRGLNLAGSKQNENRESEKRGHGHCIDGQIQGARCLGIEGENWPHGFAPFADRLQMTLCHLRSSLRLNGVINQELSRNKTGTMTREALEPLLITRIATS